MKPTKEQIIELLKPYRYSISCPCDDCIEKRIKKGTDPIFEYNIREDTLLELLSEFDTEPVKEDRKDELIKAQNSLISEIDRHEGTGIREVKLRQRIFELEKQIEADKSTES